MNLEESVESIKGIGEKTAEDYEEYIKILDAAGIDDAREKMENMVVLDFLMMNVDRHLNNFGII